MAGRAADETDPAMPAGDQPLGHRPCGSAVVDADRRHVGQFAAMRDRGDRHAQLRDQPGAADQLAIGRREQDRVGTAAHEQAHRPLGIGHHRPLDLADHQLRAQPRGSVERTDQHRTQERVLRILVDHADPAGGCAGQRARGGVGLVTELAHSGEHVLACRGAHPAGAVDDIGHRHRRDARALGHRLDGDARSLASCPCHAPPFPRYATSGAVAVCW
jgi:hypothetical protein